MTGSGAIEAQQLEAVRRVRALEERNPLASRAILRDELVGPSRRPVTPPMPCATPSASVWWDCAGWPVDAAPLSFLSFLSFRPVTRASR